MYPIKLRKVLQTGEDVSLEYTPVEVIQHKGTWTSFTKPSKGDDTHNTVIDYEALEELVNSELEELLISHSGGEDVKVAEFVIDIGPYLLYLTAMKNIETYSKSKEIFNSDVMRVPDDYVNEFHHSWNNRIGTLTTLAVYRKQPTK